MARVNIEEKAFNDIRIRRFARKLGVDHFSGLGRMAHLWRACTELGVYELSKEDIDEICEFDGAAEHLVASGLGSEGENCSIRIHGTEGRVEWLQNKRDSLQKARENRWKKKQQLKQTSDQLSEQLSDQLSVTVLCSDYQSKSKSKSKRLGEEGSGGEGDPRQLVTLWAEKAPDREQPTWPRHGIPNSVERLLMDRWMEAPDPGYWAQVFERCNTIEINDWRPSFQWIIGSDQNHLKVMSGAYTTGSAKKDTDDVSYSSDGIWYKKLN